MEVLKTLAGFGRLARPFWLSRRRWLGRHRQYRLQLRNEPDNPDQRIAEDVWLLADKSLTPFFSFINNVAKLSAFVAILWVSSGVHPVSVGGFTVMVHGYLVWVALAYSVLSTGLAHWIGHRLQGLNVERQHREADYRATLLRTVAGLWPWYEGRFRLDTARVLFVPQRPYLPQDSLRAVLCYPQWGHGDDDRLKAALAQVGLARLQDSLDQVQNWGRVLSGGEQQRISLARVLLVRPQALFLDEATGQLDPQSAAAMVRLLQQALPGALCVAISHQPEVKALFTRRAVLTAAADTP